MFQKTKKILLIAVLLFITVFFSGCINLTKKEEVVAKRKINANQGVFKSVDGGKTWEHKISLGGDEFIDNVKISSMKIDPKNNNNLFLGTVANGLYKSENGADLWMKVVDENNILSATAAINDIDIEKNNPNIIYLAAMNNKKGVLLKSDDGGKKWIESYIANETSKTVNVVKIDPISQNVVYIGTAQGGLLRSENRGLTWEPVKWFGADSGVDSILIDMKNNNGIIVKTDISIQKSVDKGENWTNVMPKIRKILTKKATVGKINSITMNLTNPLIIYATYQNLVIISRDGGDNWEVLDTITPAKTVVGTIPQIKQIGLVDNIMYYGAGNALYKSEDAGKTWSSYAISILGDVRYTVSDYTNPDVIYVGSFYDPPPPPKRQRSPLFNF
ncbi:MAG: YCF48-related protein [Minisyncoccia bacterium]